jgi:hypothetical protein
MHINNWPDGQNEPVVLVNKLRKSGFHNSDIEKITEAIDTTCNECWNKDTENEVCYCWLKKEKRMSNTQYQVHEQVGHIIKSWKPVTYLTEQYIAKEYYEQHKNNSKLRLVKVETKEIVIEEN